jgi:hypothetical protein
MSRGSLMRPSHELIIIDWVSEQYICRADFDENFSEFWRYILEM